MWHEYINAISIDEVVELLDNGGTRIRVLAGGTDLLLEMERGVRKDIETLVDISRIPDLENITLDEKDIIHLGPLVTHNQCAASKLILERAFPLAQATWNVGAPQIRNRGTIAGNLITASPANDTITPLMGMGAEITLISNSGKRVVPLDEFYRGVRKTVMNADELLIDISFPALKENQRGIFMKLGLRRAQAISLVNAAIIITFSESDKKMDLKKNQKLDQLCVDSATITLGAVAPIVIHAEDAEDYLSGKSIDEGVIEKTGQLAMEASQPIDDIRSPADYRKEIVRVCTVRGLQAIVRGEERLEFPDDPVLLSSKDYHSKMPRIKVSSKYPGESPIVTNINGKDYTFSSGHNKTLLRLIREDAGLTGTKEGCAEGECGACTIYLDGKAVMSCLVPAPRAHGAEIVTIEGLASHEELHPVQQSFIDEGAVQCGYCTPGFLMSAAKLLEERESPDRDEIRQAITGNLCRCTGYYKIVEAIEKAAENMGVRNGKI